MIMGENSKKDRLDSKRQVFFQVENNPQFADMWVSLRFRKPRLHYAYTIFVECHSIMLMCL